MENRNNKLGLKMAFVEEDMVPIKKLKIKKKTFKF